jgi:integrase/recombinase XerD
MSKRGHFKAGPKVSKSVLAIDAWPDPDRALLAKAQLNGHVLKAGGRASKWETRTLKNVLEGYGQWLKWVAEYDPDALALNPLQRVTPERVEAYVAALPRTLSSSTVQMRLQRLGQMMAAFTESKEFAWLFLAANRLRPVSVRNKRAKIQASYKLADLGFRLMREAGQREHTWHSPAAAHYRNGLIIALLAYWPIRLGNLTAITIGQHLVPRGTGFRISFSEKETKQGREIEFEAPEELAVAITNYLTIHRPALIARGGHQGTAKQALWVSRDGGPMSAGGIAGIIVKETKTAFGVAVNPHLFRDCAATTIAIDDPAHAHVIARVLGHSSMITSERHYNQAGNLEAGGQYQAVLDARRRHLRAAHKGGTGSRNTHTP